MASRFLPVNDLQVHILEATPAGPPAPLVVLLHGFPELAYSWRKVLGPLAAAGFHAVAPDQRGYGHTRPAATADLASFRMLNLAADIVALVHALGHESAAAVVGHDFGAAVAAHCALIRPDIFRSVVLMSAPFTGAPAVSPVPQLSHALAALSPPRKHYTAYFASPHADQDMRHAPQGLHAFLRAYYHAKSADAPGPPPHRLPDLSAPSLAQLPLYYVMHLDDSMPATVARTAPSPAHVAANTWLTEHELAVYTAVYADTGFQGGLNRYRCMLDPRWSDDLRVFARKKIDVPAMFLSGRQDWGVYQLPGALEKVRAEACASMREEDVVLIDGAGHWVQQEKPDAVVECLIAFLNRQQRSIDVM
ncbi:hypothetical protein C0993_012549 [Termitomyces sp. T159_Od127]|nr:hypothetical protein C0993_012549 [Termitomyces sp. T159_Od127]